MSHPYTFAKRDTSLLIDAVLPSSGTQSHDTVRKKCGGNCFLQMNPAQQPDARAATGPTGNKDHIVSCDSGDVEKSIMDNLERNDAHAVVTRPPENFFERCLGSIGFAVRQDLYRGRPSARLYSHALVAGSPKVANTTSGGGSHDIRYPCAFIAGWNIPTSDIPST